MNHSSLITRSILDTLIDISKEEYCIEDHFCEMSTIDQMCGEEQISEEKAQLYCVHTQEITDNHIVVDQQYIHKKRLGSSNISSQRKVKLHQQNNDSQLNAIGMQYSNSLLNIEVKTAQEVSNLQNQDSMSKFGIEDQQNFDFLNRFQLSKVNQSQQYLTSPKNAALDKLFRKSNKLRMKKQIEKREFTPNQTEFSEQSLQFSFHKSSHQSLLLPQAKLRLSQLSFIQSSNQQQKQEQQQQYLQQQFQQMELYQQIQNGKQQHQQTFDNKQQQILNKEQSLENIKQIEQQLQQQIQNIEQIQLQQRLELKQQEIQKVNVFNEINVGYIDIFKPLMTKKEAFNLHVYQLHQCFQILNILQIININNQLLSINETEQQPQMKFERKQQLKQLKLKNRDLKKQINNEYKYDQDYIDKNKIEIIINKIYINDIKNRISINKQMIQSNLNIINQYFNQNKNNLQIHKIAKHQNYEKIIQIYQQIWNIIQYLKICNCSNQYYNDNNIEQNQQQQNNQNSMRIETNNENQNKDKNKNYNKYQLFIGIGKEKEFDNLYRIQNERQQLPQICDLFRNINPFKQISFNEFNDNNRSQKNNEELLRDIYYQFLKLVNNPENKKLIKEQNKVQFNNIILNANQLQHQFCNFKEDQRKQQLIQQEKQQIQQLNQQIGQLKDELNQLNYEIQQKKNENGQYKQKQQLIQEDSNDQYSKELNQQVNEDQQSSEILSNDNNNNNQSRDQLHSSYNSNNHISDQLLNINNNNNKSSISNNSFIDIDNDSNNINDNETEEEYNDRQRFEEYYRRKSYQKKQFHTNNSLYNDKEQINNSSIKTHFALKPLLCFHIEQNQLQNKQIQIPGVYYFIDEKVNDNNEQYQNNNREVHIETKQEIKKRIKNHGKIELKNKDKIQIYKKDQIISTLQSYRLVQKPQFFKKSESQFKIQNNNKQQQQTKYSTNTQISRKTIDLLTGQYKSHNSQTQTLSQYTLPSYNEELLSSNDNNIQCTLQNSKQSLNSTSNDNYNDLHNQNQYNRCPYRQSINNNHNLFNTLPIDSMRIFNEEFDFHSSNYK